MKKLKPLHLGIFVAVFLTITGGVLLYFFHTQASIPQQMNYQGKLLNGSGVPQNGTFSMTFSIWDAASGGTQEWNETQSVTVTNGLFHVELGSVTPITLAFTKEYWLEVQVSGETLSPRQKITSTGYSYNSVRAGDLLVKDDGAADAHVVATDEGGRINAGFLFDTDGPSTGSVDPGGTSDLNFLQIRNGPLIGYEPAGPGHHTKFLSGIEVTGGIAYGRGICVDDDGRCTPPGKGQITALTYNTGHSDLAELYPSQESLTAGDVVVVDPNNNGEIAKSKNSYNPTVLGIISSEPGMLLGNDTDNPSDGYPVALSGRVKVKVTDEGGSIKPGDFLTTSSKEGYAQKATKSGPVIGLALESFDGQDGEVMIFVDIDRYVEVK